MLAFILRDYLVLKKHLFLLGILFTVVVFGLFWKMFGQDPVMFSTLYAFILVIQPIARDSRTSGDLLLRALPVHKRRYALYRYFSAWVGLFVLTLLLTQVVGASAHRFGELPVPPLTGTMLLLVVLLVSMATACFVPPMLRWGFGWGAFAGLALLVGTHLLALCLLGTWQAFWSTGCNAWLAELEQMRHPWGLALPLMLLNALAAYLAMVGYRRREV